MIPRRDNRVQRSVPRGFITVAEIERARDALIKRGAKPDRHGCITFSVLDEIRGPGVVGTDPIPFEYRPATTRLTLRLFQPKSRKKGKK